MANVTQSGYLASASALSFSSTSLTSLANNGYTALTDEIDNSTDLYLQVDLYVELGSAAFTGGGSALEVYLIANVDGTNYTTWGTGTSDLPANNPYFVGSIPTTQTTAAQKGELLRVSLPPGKYKWGFRNRGGVTLAASGNTVYWRPSSYAA